MSVLGRGTGIIQEKPSPQCLACTSSSAGAGDFAKCGCSVAFCKACTECSCFKPLVLGPAAKSFLQVFPGLGWEEGEVDVASHCSGLWNSSCRQQPQCPALCMGGGLMGEAGWQRETGLKDGGSGGRIRVHPWVYQKGQCT